MFDFSKHPQGVAPANIRGPEIEIVKIYKYLVVYLNNKMHWSDNMIQILQGSVEWKRARRNMQTGVPGWGRQSKTRQNKLKYNVTCNRCLHFLLPVTSLAFDTNRVRCQRRQDAVVVKRLKLI